MEKDGLVDRKSKRVCLGGKIGGKLDEARRPWRLRKGEEEKG